MESTLGGRWLVFLQVLVIAFASSAQLPMHSPNKSFSERFAESVSKPSPVEIYRA